MVIPIGVCTPTGPNGGARNPRTLFRVRLSWASLFRWYALKNARVPPAIVLSRLRRGKNGQTPVPPLQRGRAAGGGRGSLTHAATVGTLTRDRTSLTSPQSAAIMP